ncbi:MAG: SUMF1/EgtB/PvdO family nonheme iron enzyme [Chloroflexales bacterium]
MSHPDQPPSRSVNQSQQSGGVTLGAYNQFRDVVVGDTITIQTLQIISYTGDARPHDPAMRADLRRAYRSEVAARYAVWRRRYATLPMVAQPMVAPHPSPSGYEREELSFMALRHAFSSANHAPEPAPPETHTFTDLRDGLARYGHMLLLGPPGGGKTTALWRLALDLAEAGLTGDDTASLPVFVRLGGLQPGQSLPDLLRADLASASLEDAHGLRFPLTAHRALAGLLDDLLTDGRLTVLWDGLNEVPRSQFAASARALDTFRRDHPGRLGGSPTQSVTTCRADDHALLREECGSDPYPVQGVTIQGLDQETIRQVVIGRLGDAPGAALLDALSQPDHAALAGLARTPLLLTMLCEVYDAAGVLPRNRGQLLQQFVAQRWEWEQQRRPEGWIDVAIQERALADLAYEMTWSVGRGTSVSRRFAEKHLRAAGGTPDLTKLLHLGRSADLVEILADGTQVRFTHQLVQEYFAAVGLQTKLRATTKLQQGAWLRRRILARYIQPGERTGWEETLLLMAGIEGNVGMARELILSFVAQPLQAARLLEAEGASGDPGLRDEVRAEALRQVADQAIDWQRRLDAGRALTLVGDPRIPVSAEAWHTSLQNPSTTFTAAGDHYWRYVPAGRYRIGGWEKDEPTAEHDVAAFWMARLPITVAQFARFVAEGYREDAHWTPNGLTWRGNRTEPYRWGDPQYSGANQPMTIVTWYEATAFCHWLMEQLTTVLPANHELRLPTEAEWEVAAAYDGTATHRTYPWGEEALTPERAVYDAWKLNAAAPVGLCPAEASACGALDLAGNVSEWCASHFDSYPQEAYTVRKDFTDQKDITFDDLVVPSRGGSCWKGNSSDVRCGARYGVHPVGSNWDDGFRVVVSPQLAHLS